MNNLSPYELSDVTANFDNVRVPLSAKQRKNIEKVYPYYGAQNIIDYVDNYLFDGEYILVAEDGENLKSQHAKVCNLVKGKFWVNNHAHIIKGKNGNNTRYLYYYLNLIDFRPFITGSAQPKLTKDNLNSIPLNIHGIEDQKRISSILSTFDAKIELNNKINVSLEQMTKTLYNYWFVQFDFADKNGMPYKSSGGKMVWNEELKREIPEGWDDGTLGDIAELVRGVTYDSSEIKSQNESGVIPILRATNISGNVIDLNDMVYVPKMNVSPSQILNKFDILISMSSGSKEHIGKNGFFFYEKEVSFGAFCAKIVAKSEYRFYVYSYTQSDFMFTTIKNECLGTNINNLNGSLVKGFRIVVPPSELIELFNEKVSSVYEKVGNNLIENQKLTELRDWLLPMLMNGQVTVNQTGNNSIKDTPIVNNQAA